jgi:hypothetical protein
VTGTVVPESRDVRVGAGLPTPAECPQVLAPHRSRVRSGEIEFDLRVEGRAELESVDGDLAAVSGLVAIRQLQTDRHIWTPETPADERPSARR